MLRKKYEHTTQRGNVSTYTFKAPKLNIPDRTPTSTEQAMRRQHDQKLKSQKQQFNLKMAKLVLNAPTKGTASNILASLELVKHRKDQIGAVPSHLIYVSDMFENSNFGNLEKVLTSATPSSLKAQGKKFAGKVANYYGIKASDLAHVQSVIIVLPTRTMEVKDAYENLGFFYDSFFGYFNIRPQYSR